MIIVYTKPRHISKISKFLDSKNINYEIFTKLELSTSLKNVELGVSYCFPQKIEEPELSNPTKGFVNYHPGPLPEYKGPNEYQDAITNKEIHWGVTVHQMTEEYDSGKILKLKKIDLHEPPTSVEELGALSHYFLFQLFKETILDICK